MIQLKWSDETVWKDVKPLDGSDVEEQLASCRKIWEQERDRYNLPIDCEFRVKP